MVPPRPVGGWRCQGACSLAALTEEQPAPAGLHPLCHNIYRAARKDPLLMTLAEGQRGRGASQGSRCISDRRLVSSNLAHFSRLLLVVREEKKKVSPACCTIIRWNFPVNLPVFKRHICSQLLSKQRQKRQRNIYLEEKEACLQKRPTFCVRACVFTGIDTRTHSSWTLVFYIEKIL